MGVGRSNYSIIYTWYYRGAGLVVKEHDVLLWGEKTGE